MSTECGVHATRHDVAHFYVLLPVVEHDRFAHSIQSELRCVVRGSTSEWIAPGQAADVDNPAALRFAKAMKRFPAAVKRARQVRADRAVPFFNGQVRCGTEYATAGIVHKNVQP